MAEKTFRISQFKGINKKFDPSNLENECQTLNGFSVTEKPGALVKRDGYSDQASDSLPSSYPTGWTIKNFFQFNVNKPSTKTITVVHATVGGEDRIYVDYTYDGTSWNQGWVELTENEESLSAETSSSTDTIICTSLSSSTNDYYNGWYAFNWTRKAGAIVDDYTGSTGTLLLRTGITACAEDDLFSIYRYPLITQCEGAYTVDTSSATTYVIDSENWGAENFELRSDLDDIYNGWILHNTTVGDTQAISDYSGDYLGLTRKITHGTITGQTDGDSYYVYNPTRTLEVDDTIKFRQRLNNCIMTLGSSARYPKQFPLWYGYIKNTTYFGDEDTEIQAGYYLEPLTLDAPDDSIFNTITATTDSDPLDNDTYYIAAAYVYDGYQIGPLTSGPVTYTKKVTLASSDEGIAVALSIGLSSAPAMRHSRTLSKRVTALDIYMSTDYDFASSNGSFYKVARVPIRQDYNVGYSGTKSAFNTIAGRVLNSISDKFSNIAVITPFGREISIGDLWKINTFSWTGSDPYAKTVTITKTMWDNRGFEYSVEAGGFNGDRMNFYNVDYTQFHAISANIFCEESEQALVATSPLKPDGSPSPDYFPIINVINLAARKLFDIKNIHVIDNTVYFVGDTKVLKFLISNDAIMGFRQSHDFEYLGTQSEFSTLSINGGIVGVFDKGVYFLDNSENKISYPIEDIDTPPLGASSMSEAYIGYDAKKNSLYIAFPTDKQLYVYNMESGQWSIDTVADSIKAFVTSKDGYLYGADSSKIYKMNDGTLDDDTGINPSWKSKVYNYGMPDLEKTQTEVTITYKSDTAFQFDIYIDRGSAKSWNTSGDNQFAASTTPTSVTLRCPTGWRGYEFEYGITIPSALRATNTYLEIYGIENKMTFEKRS